MQKSTKAQQLALGTDHNKTISVFGGLKTCKNLKRWSCVSANVDKSVKAAVGITE